MANKLIEEDKVPIDDHLVAVIHDAVHKVMETNTSRLAVLQAGKIILDLLNDSTNTHWRITINAVCKLCRNIEPFLSKEDRITVAPVIKEASKKIKTLLGERRDPYNPLLPHRILPFETHRYNRASWYIASFIFDDPDGAGTTGGLHLAYIRTPEHIMQDGEDFDLDFFCKKNYFGTEPVLMRIHSECILGDLVIGQSRCDCGAQFREAMDSINEAGRGVLLYLRQEGRGIGLKKKLEAIEHYGGRKEGKWTGLYLNTEENMLIEGHKKADLRDYRFVGRMLRGLGITKIRLLTNNPWKIYTLKQLGFDIEQTHSAGTAISIENLCELLWKILNGYNVSFESIRKIESQIELLKQGERINPILYKLLEQLFNLIIKNENTHTVPPQLVKLLEGAAERLNTERQLRL